MKKEREGAIEACILCRNVTSEGNKVPKWKKTKDGGVEVPQHKSKGTRRAYTKTESHSNANRASAHVLIYSMFFKILFLF